MCVIIVSYFCPEDFLGAWVAEPDVQDFRARVPPLSAKPFTNTVPFITLWKRLGKACPVTVFQLRFHDVSATVTRTEGKACSRCAKCYSAQ
jgi:hypothetical protein